MYKLLNIFFIQKFYKINQEALVNGDRNSDMNKIETETREV